MGDEKKGRRVTLRIVKRERRAPNLNLRQHGWLPCPVCQGDHYVEDCTDKRTVDWWADVELDESEALNQHSQDPGEQA